MTDDYIQGNHFFIISLKDDHKLIIINFIIQIINEEIND